MSVALWWIKRDARFADNPALTAALAAHRFVLPVFAFEPSVIAATDYSVMHHHAQWQAVTYLRQRLRKMLADVYVGHGEIVEVLGSLHTLVAFTHIYSHEEIGNGITFARDRAVAMWCKEHGIAYLEFPQSSVRRTGVDRDHLQEMWQSRIVQVPPLPAPLTVPQSPEIRAIAAQTLLPVPVLPRTVSQWQSVTEADADRTLNDFLARRSKWYRGGISSPNTADTAGSRLSVHLAWGTLSTRRVWHETRNRIAELTTECHPDLDRWKRSLEAFTSRLHWRDHFTQRLESEPDLEYRSIHPAYRDVPYENDERLFAAWCEGQTGFPIVDAVMRCLATTGFVNFRMRAMVVSFACHALHLDWRFIHPHLASVFRDYDPGIHLNQLQMQAGVVGWNAIRVYSPMKQLADWDVECRFAKRWLPELRDQPPEAILHHHDSPLSVYAPPIIEFASRTQKMKDALYSIRKSREAKIATPAVYQKHGSRKKELPRTPRKPAKSKENPKQLRLFE